MRPRVEQGVEEASRPAAMRAGIEHEHRRAASRGFGEHVDRVGRADDAVGPAEQAGIGIGAVLLAAPDHARAFPRSGARRRVAQCRAACAATRSTSTLPPSRARDPSSSRPARSNAHASKRACALAPPSSNAVRGPRQVAERRELARAPPPATASSTGCRLPSSVIDVVAAQAVVLRRDHQVPVLRIECADRGSAPPCAPRARSRRVASAAWRPQPIASAGGASRARAKSAPKARSAPGQSRGAHQRQGARGVQHQSRAAGAERGGQRLGLAAIAGMAVAQRSRSIAANPTVADSGGGCCTIV